MSKHLRDPITGRCILSTPSTRKTHPGWIDEEVSASGKPSRLASQDGEDGKKAALTGLGDGSPKKKKRKRKAAAVPPVEKADDSSDPLKALIGGLNSGEDS